MPHHPRSSHLFSNTPKQGANVSPPKLPHIIAIGRVVELLPQQFQLPWCGRNVWKRRVGLTWFKKEPRIHRIFLDMFFAVRWGLFTKELGKKTGICVFPLMKLYSSRHHFTWLLSIYLPNKNGSVTSDMMSTQKKINHQNSQISKMFQWKAWKSFYFFYTQKNGSLGEKKVNML